MVLTKNEEKIKLLVYSIVIFTLAVSLSFPLVFKYVGPYAAPTGVYAVKILETNSLPSAPVTDPNKYWKSATEVEVDFPSPSLLTSIFTLISGIPKEYAMFLPIAGIGNLIYFVLARKVLCARSKIKSYGLLFSALFYAFTIFNNLHANYAGRASLGETFFAYFLFLCLLFFSESLIGQLQRSFYVLLLLIMLAMGYTYYTSIVSVMVLAILMIVAQLVVPMFKQRAVLFRAWSIGLWSTILVVSAFTCITNPFFSAFSGRITLQSFVDNIISYVTATLRIETQQNKQVLYLYYGLGRFDFITSTLRWIPSIIGYLSIIAIPVTFVLYRPKMHVHNHERAWFFFSIILLSSAGEFSYLVYGPFFPFRHMMKYGLIALLYLTEDLMIRLYARFRVQNNSQTLLATIHETKPRCRFSVLAPFTQHFWHHQKKLITTFIVLVIAFGCFGSFRVAWYYGSSGAKPFGFQKVQPISDFFIHFSGANPIILTGDVYYMASIFFTTSIYDKSNLAAEPLGMDAITLYYSFEEGNITGFLETLREKNTEYVLMVEDGRPVYGDAWGYRVILPKSLVMQESLLNLIYTNGWSKLYETQ